MLFTLLLFTIHSIQPSTSGDVISNKLFSLFNSVIDIEKIVKTYEEQTHRQFINTHELGEYVGSVTGGEFNEAFLALKHIKDTAKDAYDNHVWNNDMSNVYYDGFTNPLISSLGTKLPLYYEERYSANVSLKNSAINLPLDVYDNWTEVRNTIQWTEILNDAFTNNYAKNSDNIFWQYIGTPQGVMRTFPATYISAKDQITFDVRKRPWYNAGIGCPKDVIMLMDTSGSLDGFPLRLLKTTAKMLINLILADTDFVTAIDVGHKAKFLTCFTHMMRAAKAVKKTLIDAIENIQPKGTSNWEDGLRLAFHTFNYSRNIRQSTFCEQAIVLFTDETGQRVDEIVKEFNPKKRVRVYVFSFKRNEGLYTDRLKEMACANRGYYKKILYFGQIESALQDLVTIGNTPLKGKTVAPTWSNAYIDLGGFGLVITVTLPIVVDTSATEIETTGIEGNNSVSLLGIVGLDFKSSRIVQISNSILPMGSTSVIINNKGYPIYHPRIDKYEYEDVNTKLHNFQFTDENKKGLIELETHMIDRKHELLRIKGFINVEHQPRGAEWYQELVYQIFPVENTPFSIACIYSSYPPTYLMYQLDTVNIEDINNIIQYWQENHGILIDFEDNSCKINEVIARGRGPYNLDKDDMCSSVIFSMFTDIYISKSFKDAFLWPKGVDLISHYIITYTGITFFSDKHWNSTAEASMSTLVPYSKVLKNITDAVLFISVPLQREKYESLTVNITQRINVTAGNLTSQVAAAGFEIRLSELKKYLFSTTTEANERFLIDENGFIVLGHPTDKSGFLGEEYPFLMQALLKRKVYEVINYTECINTCPEILVQNHSESAAFRPLLWNIFHYLIRLMSYLKWVFYLNLPDYVESNHIRKEHQVECCKMFKHYQRNFIFKSTNLWIEEACRCTSRFKISVVKGTNLILVIDHTPACKCPATRQSPAKGVRVSNSIGCTNELFSHGDREEPGFEELHTHYYVSSKTCIISYDDDNICSSTGGVRNHISLVPILLLVFCLFSR